MRFGSFSDKHTTEEDILNATIGGREAQNEHFGRDILKFDILWLNSAVFLRVFLPTPKILYSKIDFLREPFINSHDMSPCTTPATTWALCPRTTQHFACDLQEPRNTASLKCCEMKVVLLESRSKVLRVSQTMTFRALSNI